MYYLRDRTGKSARIAEKIRKNIGIDIETVPEQATPENIVQEKNETKPQEIIKETSEKKVSPQKMRLGQNIPASFWASFSSKTKVFDFS